MKLSKLWSFKPRKLHIRYWFLSSIAACGMLMAGLAVPSHATVESESSDALECTALTEFDFPSTSITSAQTVPTGTLSHRGQPIEEHCLVTGQMNERVSEIDGQEYAIGFEIRLPNDWSGQYLFQGNGGLDGAVNTALGTAGGSDSALQMGMAVLSSDAGHSSDQNPSFGLDPQARLDYGYQAVETLTPMAKTLIETVYGDQPEYSYMAGSSNGGRHTMVGASRYSDDYDGFLAVAPGFNLPKAATAQLWGAQQWNTVATSDDLNSALTPDERVLVADSILEQCDGLDGVEDQMVFNSAACQEVFDVSKHVPTCEAERDGSCLSEEQQNVIATIFDGATTSGGDPIYSSFPYDPGMTGEDWGSWKFEAPIERDSVAVGYIFSSPPYAPELNMLRDFVLNLDIDEANVSLYASSGEYSEGAIDFMLPPDLTYQDLKASGGKMLVMHGASDGVFSMEDTSSWYQDLTEAHGGDASNFVQYYEIPGMNHTRGGPATDQHNSLTALVNWVENGEQPSAINAWVDPENDAVPNDWSSERSRPLCAYPETASYVGGDPEDASSFECGVAEAPVELNPSIEAEPTDVNPGETTDVSGTGYTPDSTVTVTITDAADQQIDNIESVETNESGLFSTQWSVPEDMDSGDATITATDTSYTSASASVVVQINELPVEPSSTNSSDDSTSSETSSASAAPSSQSSSESYQSDPASTPRTPSSSEGSPIDVAAADDEGLALTGASGIVALVVSAIVLLILGAGIVLYTRKHRAHH